MRITRFLRNASVSIPEMVETALERCEGRVAGRHVLAIQDTTTVRAAADGSCIALHPMIAVDAIAGSLLGLVEAQIWSRAQGKNAQRKERDFVEKDSRRWLSCSQSAERLSAAGAACVTMVADREGDIYEDFACRPTAVEVLIRASQDRALSDGTRLFDKAGRLAEAGTMTVDLPAAPGRRAREAVLSLRFCTLEIARPQSRRRNAEWKALPESVQLSLVESREINPPPGTTPAHWRLLTSHAVKDLADARRIVGFYRQRWIIEQLFRTLKTKGFDVEALRLVDGGPFEKLVMACLVAAVSVLQLVQERDGIAKRPLIDTFDPEDQPTLEALSASLEGKTAKQKNPHPRGSLAFAAWVLARLGGWTGYYGKPGPIVMVNGLVQFHAIKHGWKLRNL